MGREDKKLIKVLKAVAKTFLQWYDVPVVNKNVLVTRGREANMFVLRLLAYLIDWLIAYLPIYLLLQLLPSYEPWAGTISVLLFLTYNIVLLLVNEGQTLGKKIAQIQVIYQEDRIMRVNLSFFIREITKCFYLLIGIIGISAIILNFLFYIWQKRMIQDVLGQTEVIFKKV